MNVVHNYRFADSQLTWWQQSGSPTYIPNDGNSQLGCVSLGSDGDALEQTAFLRQALTYTLVVACKTPSSGSFKVEILNQDDAVAYTNTIAATLSWAETSVAINLPADEFTVKLSWVSGTVYVDDVYLAHIPATRLELAEMAHRELSDLATEFGLTYEPTDDPNRTEGDYTQAVSSALREVGAVDERHIADTRYLEANEINEAVERIVHHMLPILHNKAMLKPTSVTMGPVTDRFGMLGALEKRMGIVPGQANVNPKGVVQRRMTYE